MAEPMSEEEYRFLLDEANKAVQEEQKKLDAIMDANYEAFLPEHEIPDFKDALVYMNYYDKLRERVEKRGEKITCAVTNRRAKACSVAIRREMEARGSK